MTLKTATMVDAISWRASKLRHMEILLSRLEKQDYADRDFDIARLKTRIIKARKQLVKTAKGEMVPAINLVW
jgi:hypothetical protein